MCDECKGNWDGTKQAIMSGVKDAEERQRAKEQPPPKMTRSKSKVPPLVEKRIRAKKMQGKGMLNQNCFILYQRM